MAGLLLVTGRPWSMTCGPVLDAVCQERRGVAGTAGRLPAARRRVQVLRAVEPAGTARHPCPPAAAAAPPPSGPPPEPTAVIVDSQIVNAADTAARATRGYHGGKKINGRGRHAAVDAEGWLLSVVVTGAQVSDRAGAKLLAIALLNTVTTLKIMWTDSGYDGKPLATWMRQAAGLTLQIIKPSDQPGFQVVSRRWVVERTFGWLMLYRRLARDYERTTAHHEAMIYWSTVLIMTSRLASYKTGTPTMQRWGGDRRKPPPDPDDLAA